jgi:hypothetical protein
VFGFLRPCRHHLPPELHARWSEHLCGLCLALRDEAGQLAADDDARGRPRVRLL